LWPIGCLYIFSCDKMEWLKNNIGATVPAAFVKTTCIRIQGFKGSRVQVHGAKRMAHREKRKGLGIQKLYS
jgi:hypothetical protein